jgi:GH24 family phage-related lysozyme (muramidase)
MIYKLKDLLSERNMIKLKQEDVTPDHAPMFKAPYNAHELTPPAHHAYADPAGDKNAKGMKPYTSNQDFTGFSTAKKFEITNDFVNYIKKVENGIKKNFSNGKWTPYVDYIDDSGKKIYSIAYGHKVSSSDNVAELMRGISDQRATELLKKDIENAKSKVNAYLTKNRLPTNLSQKQWEMLIDYAFNLGGVEKFPEMTKAVVHQDMPKAKREYKRSKTTDGKKSELVGRNTAYYNRYLTSGFK